MRDECKKHPSLRVECCAISCDRAVGAADGVRRVGRLILGRLPQRLLDILRAHRAVHWPT